MPDQPSADGTPDGPSDFTPLHVAAQQGRAADVAALLARGADPNARERGDDTTPLHWAAAAGSLDVVRQLIDAGADVVGDGDDHQLQVIGWASCWDGCDDAAHRAVVDLLVARGARHHVFSAIALDLADEVRRLVAADAAVLAQPMSRNESHQRPLHFAVRMNRPAMVALLLALGADPAATDGAGMTAAVYASAPTVGRAVIAALAHAAPDLFAALALGDEATAARLLAEDADRIRPGGRDAHVLHLLAKRGALPGVRWLLDRGADPNATWGHWDARVTPLHLAAWQGHEPIVRLLLERGADPARRDDRHDGDALGWAEHGGQLAVVHLLRAHPPTA